MKKVLRISIVAMCSSLILAVSLPVMASQPQQGEMVNVNYDDMDTDLGFIHIFLYPAAYFLSNHSGGMAGATTAVELGDNLAVRANAFIPNPLFGMDEFGPNRSTTGFRFEAAAQFHGSSINVETESITTKSSTQGNMVHTETVNVPVAVRNSRGLGGGLLYRAGGASVAAEGRKSKDTIGHHLTAFAGVQIISSSTYTVTIEDRGTYSNTRFMLGGIDALYDVVQSYDVELDENPGRWGGRLWVETSFAKFIGLAGRMEIGKQPGGSGWYFSAGLGGSLNL